MESTGRRKRENLHSFQTRSWGDGKPIPKTDDTNSSTNSNLVDRTYSSYDLAGQILISVLLTFPILLITAIPAQLHPSEKGPYVEND
jgi:hypothetical protein